VPKDGPSAGIGMVTAMISTLTGIPVRRDVAMTGEVTLRGRVLPIGGSRRSCSRRLRGGITTVLIPAENEKDLAEIPASVKEGARDHPGQPCRRGAGRRWRADRADRMDRGRRAGRLPPSELGRGADDGAGFRSALKPFVTSALTSNFPGSAPLSF
jgi:hypothetical protein